MSETTKKYLNHINVFSNIYFQLDKNLTFLSKDLSEVWILANITVSPEFEITLKAELIKSIKDKSVETDTKQKEKGTVAKSTEGTGAKLEPIAEPVAKQDATKQKKEKKEKKDSVDQKAGASEAENSIEEYKKILKIFLSLTNTKTINSFPEEKKKTLQKINSNFMTTFKDSPNFKKVKIILLKMQLSMLFSSSSSSNTELDSLINIIKDTLTESHPEFKEINLTGGSSKLINDLKNIKYNNIFDSYDKYIKYKSKYMYLNKIY